MLILVSSLKERLSLKLARNNFAYENRFMIISFDIELIERNEFCKINMTKTNLSNYPRHQAFLIYVTYVGARCVKQILLKNLVTAVPIFVYNLVLKMISVRKINAFTLLQFPQIQIEFIFIQRISNS